MPAQGYRQVADGIVVSEDVECRGTMREENWAKGEKE